MALYDKPLTSRSIRLVRLLPTLSPDDLIACTVATVPLDSDPQYHALSCACGQQTLREDILCNGATLSVTRNLHEALWQLRQDGYLDPLWIDAISIN